MRELLPMSAYDVDRSVSFTRVGFAFALWWFVAMTIAHLGDRAGLIFNLISTGIAALVIWPLFAVGMRGFMGRMVRRLYDGNTSMVPAPPPPPGRYGYDFRVLCSLLRGRIMVGGHLYVGPENLVFVPHTKNLRRHRQPVHWKQPENLSVSTEPAQLWWLQKFVGARPTDRLVVADNGLRTLFAVPDAQLVRDELDVYLMSAHSP